MARHDIDFEHRIDGIPCGIVVGEVYYDRDCGWHTEFIIVDRKGYDAEWLEKKATWYELDEISDIVVEHVERENFIEPWDD